MFCPKCKAEYIKGVTECADCHVPLVPNLPKEDNDEEIEEKTTKEAIEWTPLLTCVNQADVALIKSILESEDIPYWIQGENRFLSRSGLQGAVFHVDKTRLQDAKNLTKDLSINIFGFSTRSSDDLA